MEVRVQGFALQHAIVDVKADVEKHVQGVAKINVVETAQEVAVLIVLKDVVADVQRAVPANVV